MRLSRISLTVAELVLPTTLMQGLEVSAPACVCGGGVCCKHGPEEILLDAATWATTHALCNDDADDGDDGGGGGDGGGDDADGGGDDADVCVCTCVQLCVDLLH